MLPFVNLCRLVAALERKVLVYVLETLQLLSTIETPCNDKVICRQALPDIVPFAVSSQNAQNVLCRVYAP